MDIWKKKLFDPKYYACSIFTWKKISLLHRKKCSWSAMSGEWFGLGFWNWSIGPNQCMVFSMYMHSCFNLGKIGEENKITSWLNHCLSQVFKMPFWNSNHFSSACPNCEMICFSPQRSQCKEFFSWKSLPVWKRSFSSTCQSIRQAGLVLTKSFDSIFLLPLINLSGGLVNPI